MNSLTGIVRNLAWLSTELWCCAIGLISNPVNLHLAPSTYVSVPICDVPVLGSAMLGRRVEQIQFLLGHVSVQTTERYFGCKQRIRSAANDRIGIEPNP
jgi:hypothetical protein